MGQIYSSVKNYFFVKPLKVILIYGFEDVGKSAVFDKMQMDSEFYPMPSPYVHEGIKNQKDFTLHFCKIARTLTASYKDHYFINDQCDAVIFVIDSTDPTGMDEVNQILRHMQTSEELKNAVFLIYANKQDLPNAIEPAKVAEMIKLQEINRTSHIVGTSGLTGEGVLEGLEWLNSVFSKKKWFNFF